MVAASYSPIHEASLVDPALHSQAVLEMLDIKVSRTLIEYAVDCIVETVDYAMGKPSTSARGRSTSRNSAHANFLNFVTNVITKAEVKVPVLLVALVYIDRAKPHLQIALEQWACERVFLGALILANKYCNDSTLKNVHWALCTGVFGKRDIGRIEREFLDVLDYELSIHESDLLSHHDAIMSLVSPTRFNARSHHHSQRQQLVSAPASPHHFVPSQAQQQIKLTPASTSLPSHWSSDSDSGEESDDMHSSPSMSPPPQTPHMDVEPTFVAPVLAKQAHEEAADSHPHHPHSHSIVHAASAIPISQHTKQIHVQVHPELVHSYSHSHPPSAHHPRLSSALQLLRSFPIPHFHHASSASSSASSPLSAVSVTSSSSAESAMSVAARCKPISSHPHPNAHHFIPPVRPARVMA